MHAFDTITPSTPLDVATAGRFLAVLAADALAPLAPTLDLDVTNADPGTVVVETDLDGYVYALTVHHDTEDIGALAYGVDIAPAETSTPDYPMGYIASGMTPGGAVAEWVRAVRYALGHGEELHDAARALRR